MSRTPILLCYPRVASRFFTSAFEERTNVYIEKTHDPDYLFLPEHDIISIVRKPLDAIASEISMGHFLNKTPENDQIFVDKFIERYVKINTVVLKKAKIILTYEDVIGNVDLAVERAIKTINIKKNKNTNKPNKTEIKDMFDPLSGYLVSSKSYNQYEKIKEKVLGFDLSRANEVYDAAAKRAVFHQ
jgi:hypothetical protein